MEVLVQPNILLLRVTYQHRSTCILAFTLYFSWRFSVSLPLVRILHAILVQQVKGQVCIDML